MSEPHVEREFEAFPLLNLPLEALLGLASSDSATSSLLSVSPSVAWATLCATPTWNVQSRHSLDIVRWLLRGHKGDPEGRKEGWQHRRSMGPLPPPLSLSLSELDLAESELGQLEADVALCRPLQLQLGQRWAYGTLITDHFLTSSLPLRRLPPIALLDLSNSSSVTTAGFSSLSSLNALTHITLSLHSWGITLSAMRPEVLDAFPSLRSLEFFGHTSDHLSGAPQPSDPIGTSRAFAAFLSGDPSLVHPIATQAAVQYITSAATSYSFGQLMWRYTKTGPAALNAALTEPVEWEEVLTGLQMLRDLAVARDRKHPEESRPLGSLQVLARTLHSHARAGLTHIAAQGISLPQALSQPRARREEMRGPASAGLRLYELALETLAALSGHPPNFTPGALEFSGTDHCSAPGVLLGPLEAFVAQPTGADASPVLAWSLKTLASMSCTFKDSYPVFGHCAGRPGETKQRLLQHRDGLVALLRLPPLHISPKTRANVVVCLGRLAVWDALLYTSCIVRFPHTIPLPLESPERFSPQCIQCATDLVRELLLIRDDAEPEGTAARPDSEFQLQMVTGLGVGSAPGSGSETMGAGSEILSLLAPILSRAHRTKRSEEGLRSAAAAFLRDLVRVGSESDAREPGTLNFSWSGYYALLPGLDVRRCLLASGFSGEFVVRMLRTQPEDAPPAAGPGPGPRPLCGGGAGTIGTGEGGGGRYSMHESREPQA